MTTKLDKTIDMLGEGTTLSLDSGEVIFKLDSYQDNPIVMPQDIGLTWKEDGVLKTGAVFNGGAEVFEEKIILLPRCHSNYRKSNFFDQKLGIERIYMENYISEILPLSSEDGIHFSRLDNVVIKGDGSQNKDFAYGIEDLRIIRYKEKYLLIGCGKVKPPFTGDNADRIVIYSTTDFVHITYHGIIETFDSRNAIFFFDPEREKHYMLLRFHPNIHLIPLDEGVEPLLNPVKYKKYWEKIYTQQTRNLLLRCGENLHEKEKIGPSTPLIKTAKGWLFIYHAVGEIKASICKVYGRDNKIERGYSICAALLDLDNPLKIVCRTKSPIYIPNAPYELKGNEAYPIDVPAVIFPVGVIVRKNKLLLYCGAGDKYTVLLSCDLKKLLDYLGEYCRV